MTQSRRIGGHPRRINLSGGPVPGIGGLSLVALATLVALVTPQLWWAAVWLVVAGIVVGLALLWVRRRAGLHSERRYRSRQLT